MSAPPPTNGDDIAGGFDARPRPGTEPAESLANGTPVPTRAVGGSDTSAANGDTAARGTTEAFSRYGSPAADAGADGEDTRSYNGHQTADGATSAGENGVNDQDRARDGTRDEAASDARADAEEPGSLSLGSLTAAGQASLTDSGPVTLAEAFIDAGGSEKLPDPVHQFTSAHVGPVGRRLLRVVGVDTTSVPAGEQWKLYAMASTVLLNAGLGAAFVPIGAVVAYGHLSIAGIAVGAALGFFAIGIIDALVVGHWHSYARHFTRIDPKAPMPKMPGTLARCAVLAPRLLVTAGLVFTLGLMLTLSVNRQAVRQAMGTQDAQHNKANSVSLLRPDNIAIARATTQITADLTTRRLSIAAATRYQKLSSCELRGFPVVPGCSGHIGPGELSRRYAADARNAAANAQAEEQSIRSERAAIRAAQANEQAVKHSPQYKLSMIPSTGIIAATSAYDAYVREHHVPWYDAWRMDLLLAVLDLTPLLIKLGSGTTQYEAELWWRAHRRAVLARAEDGMWIRSLQAHDQLHDGVAEAWVGAGVKRATRRLADAAARPPQRPAPEPAALPRGPSRAAPPAPEPASTPRPPRGEDPFNLRRNARLGDVIHLSDGDYILLALLSREKSRNADVFIGVEVPKPGQQRPNARNRNPVRAIKLTKFDEGTGDVVRMSAAELALLDNFPTDPALLEPGPLTESHDGRIAYTMHYHPRGDIERYAYGNGPDRLRLTNLQAANVGLTVVRALQNLWDADLIHNDARLRNILLTGPLLGDSDRLSLLAPGPSGHTLLTDYNFVSRPDGTYRNPPGMVVNPLDGDPALIRWMLEHCYEDGMPSPLGLATDCYAPFAVVYTLLTGGLSPTTALLRAHNWSRQDIQRFDTADTMETWQDLLAGEPGLLSQDPPSLADFGVASPLARAIDAGVRADPLMRQPQIAGAGDISPSIARGYIEEALGNARDACKPRWLRRPIPTVHDDHPWRGLIEPPVGFPDEVIEYLGKYWPAFVKGGAA
jgi:hypothetical protein